LTADYETAPITSRVSRIADGVLLSFDSETQFLLMTPRGARQIAEQLIAATRSADISDDSLNCLLVSIG
jgi:hypothetical protein